MPLDKSGSPQAMGNNIKAEMAAGKPQKQAIAIAYAVKREKRTKSIKPEIVKHMHKLKTGLRT